MEIFRSLIYFPCAFRNITRFVSGNTIVYVVYDKPDKSTHERNLLIRKRNMCGAAARIGYKLFIQISEKVKFRVNTQSAYSRCKRMCYLFFQKKSFSLGKHNRSF